MRGLKILAEGAGLWIALSIMLILVSMLATIAPGLNNILVCLWGMLCVGSLAVPLWWIIIRLGDPVPPALRLKQARWEYRKWAPWVSIRARVTSHQTKKKKKRQLAGSDAIDGTLTHTVRGSGIQRVQLISLAEGTYTVHYSFAGRCRVNVELIHAIDRYQTELLNRVTGSGSATVSIPEDAYFFR